jgi:2-oxoisovalerate dehydrogenase E1 component
MPSTPADTYGLLRAAIRDPNPVVFIENRQLYGVQGPKPPAGHILPLGKAKVVREGTNATIVSVSRMAGEAVAAAEARRTRRGGARAHLTRVDFYVRPSAQPSCFQPPR